jgi:hypothetical protein
MRLRVFSTMAAVAALAALALLTTAPAAPASPKLLVGIFDEGETFYDDPAVVFPTYKALKTQILRVGLHWGGRLGVARARPLSAADPEDPAYDWSLYDRTVQYANQYGQKVLFSIVDTPSWANGGKPVNRAPLRYSDLQAFAEAAATRYSGTYIGDDGRTLPAVRYWTAWNEPNNPVFLSPQYTRSRGGWVMSGAAAYAKICNAVYDGIHGTLLKNEKVACGVTGPRGNNSPTSSRPSVSPLAFLRATKSAGMKRFDAYAHHPYYGQPNETPTTPPPAARGAKPTAVTLGNINDLIVELTRLYGPKPVWLTEYGYQTNPPDKQFGVSWAKQAQYLTQAFAIARKNPRIDMMLWFLARDEPSLAGWQSGLQTRAFKKKPAWNAFIKVPRPAKP